jgi:hypothetical protein
MKVILQASIFVVIATLLGQCSTSTHNSNLQSSYAPVPFEENANSEEGLPAIPYETMLGEITNLSKKVGISNLREANLSGSETEVRIWNAGGLIIPVCLVLKIQNESSAAVRVAPKIVGDRAIFDKQGKPIYVKTDLGSPRSGWSEIVSYLREQEIIPSVKLALDKRFMPEPDQLSIIIEVKTGAQYSMVHYAEFTESKDGKRALNVSRRIENEFGKMLGWDAEPPPNNSFNRTRTQQVFYHQY